MGVVTAVALVTVGMDGTCGTKGGVDGRARGAAGREGGREWLSIISTQATGGSHTGVFGGGIILLLLPPPKQATEGSIALSGGSIVNDHGEHSPDHSNDEGVVLIVSVHRAARITSQASVASIVKALAVASIALVQAMRLEGEFWFWFW